MKTTTASSTLLPLLAAFLLGGSTTLHAGPGADVPANYPLKKCVISDEALGEHGKPVKMTAEDGTDVYLCCKMCVKDFKKDPAKYAKMVKDARPKTP